MPHNQPAPDYWDNDSTEGRCDNAIDLSIDECQCCEPDACIGWGFDPVREIVIAYGQKVAKAYHHDGVFCDLWNIKSISIIAKGEGACTAMVDGDEIMAYDDREDAEAELKKWMD